MSATDDLLARAAHHGDGFDHGGLPRPPATGVAIVACMDARLNLSGLLGLAEGDAHVIRNAGGIVTQHELRALAISQRKMGTTEIMVIHHTDCGVLGFSDDDFRQELEAETGVRPTWTDVGFDDLEGSVRDSVAAIEASPFIPHKESVRGFLYDVKTGKLAEVV
jgi:carbonic anhydrase